MIGQLHKGDILWLDNDPGYIKPYVLALEEVGYRVILVTSAMQAEELVASRNFDLVILDVMIPTVSVEEENLYPPEQTDGSLRTGLVFFGRVRTVLMSRGVPVLVMTVRIDAGVKEEFISAGLAKNGFATKMELREIPVFLSKIAELIHRRTESGLG